MLGQLEIKVNQIPAWQHFMQAFSILGHTVYELITRNWVNQSESKKCNTLGWTFINSIILIHWNRVYEKIMEKMKAIGQQNTGLKRKIAEYAKGVALKGNMNLEKGWVFITSLVPLNFKDCEQKNGSGMFRQQWGPFESVSASSNSTFQ